MKKKLLTLLLCSILMLTLFPGGVSAANSELLILGDSITTGYGLTGYTPGDNYSAEGSFGSQIAASLGLTAQDSYLNFAKDGATSTDLLIALNAQTADGESLRAAIEACDTLVISIGGNDLLGPFIQLIGDALTAYASQIQSFFGITVDTHDTQAIFSTLTAILAKDTSGIALGLLNTYLASGTGTDALTGAVSDFAVNLSSLLTVVRSLNPTADLVLLNVYNPFSGVTSMTTLAAYADAFIKGLNKAIDGGADLGNYQVVDTYAKFYNQSAVYTNIAGYDIHPNATGHSWIAETILGNLDDDEPGTSDQPDIVNPGFNDVHTNNWYYRAVSLVYSHGLFGGIGNNLFAPDDAMTRAMFVTVLWRLDGQPKVTEAPSFSDVTAGYYVDAVAWAAQNNIVKGVGNGLFKPSSEVTRQEMAVIFDNYLTARGITLPTVRTTTPPDLDDAATWAKSAITTIYHYGVINGINTAGTFDPKATASRAQVAQIFTNYLVANGDVTI